jgi:hypothetical protein
MQIVPMTINTTETSYVFCVKNDDYPVSLELRKVYRVVLDEWATAHGHIRIIDESGEDYLYPVGFFVPVALPEAAESVFALAA